jgi:signal transduction histidine kinase
VQLPLATVTSADFTDLGTTGHEGVASLVQDETDAGRAVIVAGGVPSSAPTLLMWARTLIRERLFIVPLIGSLLTFLGGLFAIPIVLRSLRPTARAAAELDGSDLQRRLPEKGVVKELLPIVRSFNTALDRVSEAFERRRRFIADVAHELRTPLAVLNMHVEALPDASTKPDLQRTVFRLGQMVGQMLDAERLVLAGRKREPVDLVQIARDAIAQVAPLAISNGYTPAFASETESVIIEGDPHAIARAISNLLGNAIAHGGGSGTIDVRVKADGTVDVADEGPGVPAEARERIFEPFHRERWDRDGAGLGLHLVREIMRAHGGDARLVNGESGAVFRLEFRPN